MATNGSPAFTVLITNYNDAQFLPTALEAILSQEPGPDQVIIADDGSTDDSVDVIEEWARQYDVIELVRNPRNIGPIETANRILPQVRGDFFSWWSADDVIKPGLFAQAVAAAQQFPHASVLATGTETVTETDRGHVETHDFGISENFVCYDANEFCRINRRRYVWLGSSGLFLRTQDVVAYHGWNPDFDWFADWALSYSLALMHSVVLINTIGSRSVKRKGSFGAKARSNPERRSKAIRNFLAFLTERQNRSLKRRFRRALLILPYAFGQRIFIELLKNPGCWDILAVCALGWLHHRFMNLMCKCKDFLSR